MQVVTVECFLHPQAFGDGTLRLVPRQAWVSWAPFCLGPGLSPEVMEGRVFGLQNGETCDNILEKQQ